MSKRRLIPVRRGARQRFRASLRVVGRSV